MKNLHWASAQVTAAVQTVSASSGPKANKHSAPRLYARCVERLSCLTALVRNVRKAKVVFFCITPRKGEERRKTCVTGDSDVEEFVGMKNKKSLNFYR